MTRKNEESVLSRWSRLKSEAVSEKPIEVEPIGSEQHSTPVPTAGGEAGAMEPADAERPLLTDADMPPIESLSEDSDFSGFMSAGVSDELRNLALRKLFKAPVFNIRDGLDEYDEDYTSFEKLGDIVTADMKHRIEMQEQKLREKLAAEQELEAQRADPDAVEDIDDQDIDDEDELESQSISVASAEAQADADQEKENGQ